jgi:hypothetical protein
MVILKQTRFSHVCKLFGGFAEINCSEVTLLCQLLIHQIIHHLDQYWHLLTLDFLADAHG